MVSTIKENGYFFHDLRNGLNKSEQRNSKYKYLYEFAYLIDLLLNELIYTLTPLKFVTESQVISQRGQNITTIELSVSFRLWGEYLFELWFGI